MNRTEIQEILFELHSRPQEPQILLKQLAILNAQSGVSIYSELIAFEKASFDFGIEDKVKSLAKLIRSHREFDVISLLLCYLFSSEAHALENAAYLLGEIGDIRAISPLILLIQLRNPIKRDGWSEYVVAVNKALEVSDFKLKQVSFKTSEWDKFISIAVEALGKLKALSAVETLANLLIDKTWKVRYNVIQSLCNIGNPIVAKTIANFIIKDSMSDQVQDYAGTSYYDNDRKKRMFVAGIKALKSFGSEQLLADVGSNSPKELSKLAYDLIEDNQILGQVSDKYYDYDNGKRLLMMGGTLLNQELLRAFVSNKESEIWEKALDQILDQSILIEIAKGSDEYLVSKAVARIHSEIFLEELFDNCKSPIIFNSLVDKMYNEKIFICYALGEKYVGIQEAILSSTKIKSESELSKVATNSPFWQVRCALIKRLQNVSFLMHIAESDFDGSVCDAALERLNELGITHGNFTFLHRNEVEKDLLHLKVIILNNYEYNGVNKIAPSERDILSIDNTTILLSNKQYRCIEKNGINQSIEFNVKDQLEINYLVKIFRFSRTEFYISNELVDKRSSRFAPTVIDFNDAQKESPEYLKQCIIASLKKMDITMSKEESINYQGYSYLQCIDYIKANHLFCPRSVNYYDKALHFYDRDSDTVYLTDIIRIDDEKYLIDSRSQWS
jgi:hypothetical protein